MDIKGASRSGSIAPHLLDLFNEDGWDALASQHTCRGSNREENPPPVPFPIPKFKWKTRIFKSP